MFARQCIAASKPFVLRRCIHFCQSLRFATFTHSLPSQRRSVSASQRRSFLPLLSISLIRSPHHIAMNNQPQLPQSVSIVPSNVRQDDSETSGGSKRPTSGDSKSLPSINFPDEIIRDYRLMKELPCEVIFHKCKKVYNPVSNGSVVESPLPSFVVITAVAIAAAVVAAPFFLHRSFRCRRRFCRHLGVASW